MPERAGLAPPRNPQNDELGIASMQHIGAKLHVLELAGHKVLDKHMRRLSQLQQQLAALLGPEIESDALLVASVDLPIGGDAFDAPVAQIVPTPRGLDLQDFGAEVCQ